MCTHIGADYGTICGLIWFIFGLLVILCVLYILLNFQINCTNSFKAINLFYCPALGEQLAVQTCHALQRER